MYSVAWAHGLASIYFDLHNRILTSNPSWMTPKEGETSILVRIMYDDNTATIMNTYLDTTVTVLHTSTMYLDA